MRIKLKGGRDIPTITKTGGIRQIRTQDDIFNELARVNWEKVRLNKEKINCQERIDQLNARFNQIDARLKQIEKIEKSLQQQMEQSAAKDQKERLAAKEKMADKVEATEQTASRNMDKEKSKEIVIRY